MQYRIAPIELELQRKENGVVVLKLSFVEIGFLQTCRAHLYERLFCDHDQNDFRC